jgi:hypothetical protein
MQTLEATTARHRTLPDVDLIWIKSQLFGRQAEVERTLHRLYLSDTLARAVVGAFAAFWLALSWPGMQSFVLGLWTGTGGSEIFTAANPWPTTLISMAAALLAVVVVRLVHPIITRD